MYNISEGSLTININLGFFGGNSFIHLFLTFNFMLEYTNEQRVIVSGGQHSNAATHARGSSLSHTPLPSRLPRSVEQSPLRCTVGPCWSCFLNRAVFFQHFLISLCLFNSLPHCWLYFYLFILQNFKLFFLQMILSRK